MFQQKNLAFYANAFTKLRRDYKNGGAPHKPILLISVLQAFQQRLFLDKCIYITPELVGIFRSNWNFYVTTKHDCRFALPFFHLSNEKADFWTLIPNNGFEQVIISKYAMRNFKNLVSAVQYAEINEELLDLLLNEDTNILLQSILIEKYFPEKKNIPPKGYKYLDNISADILNDSNQEYAEKIKKLSKTMTIEEYEEEIFVRSGRFKKEVLSNFNNTCCISKLRIDVIDNISMLDACHITPFSETYDDTITNGFALTPTLHRAFDRGLIGVDDDYKVIVSSKFIEKYASNYSLKQFEGELINLPINKNLKPSIENFAKHRKRFDLTR